MISRRASRNGLKETIVRHVPGVGALARTVARIAQLRVGRLPAGLLLLLPIAIALDLFDVADELALGPVGVALSFVAESAYLLAITGSALPALGMAAFDVIPFVDVIPFCTLATIRAIAREWTREARAPAGGPVIDV